MSAFFIALINPIGDAIANHLDKYILSRWLKNSNPGSMVLFTSLFALTSLPILYFLNREVVSQISLLNKIILIGNGGLIVVALFLYFFALNEDETSFVSPLFQLIPVFSLVFSYFFLGEKLNLNQAIGCFAVILGGTILSLKITSEKLFFKKRVLLLMTLSSFFYSINAIIFKSIASEENFTNSLFWAMLGKFIFGFLIFIFFKNLRNSFIETIKTNHFKVLIFIFLNETLAIIGDIAIFYAILFNPVALVQSINSLQSFFVLIFGVIFTLFIPNLAKESIQTSHLLQKFIAISLIVFGVYQIK